MYSMENAIVERKIINVTGKRQVTIPLKFCDKPGFGKEKEAGELPLANVQERLRKTYFGRIN